MGICLKHWFNPILSRQSFSYSSWLPGVNKGDDEDSDVICDTIASVSDDKLLEIIKIVQTTYDKFVRDKIELQQLEHSVLGEDIRNEDLGK